MVSEVDDSGRASSSFSQQRPEITTNPVTISAPPRNQFQQTVSLMSTAYPTAGAINADHKEYLAGRRRTAELALGLAVMA
jgi:hypothetical protein